MDTTVKVEQQERGKWGNKLEFLLSALGFAVGLGNVWRYPYIAYRNGGGAFLIPYWTCVFAFAIPLMYLELVVGQYSSLGPNLAYHRLCPPLRGLGYTMLLQTMAVSIYYNVIMAKSFYYLFVSFTSAENLPFDKCEESWNTIFCYSSISMRKCYAKNGSYAIGHCFEKNDSVPDYFADRKRKANADFKDGNITWCGILCKLHNKVRPKMRKNESNEEFEASDMHARTLLLQQEFWKTFGEQNCGSSLVANPQCNLQNNSVDFIPTHDIINKTERWLIEKTNTLTLAAEEYHDRFVTGLALARDSTDIGPSTLKPHLIGCLALSWIVCFFCLIQGVKSSGKVVYFTATYPYLALTIFLIAGSTLKGAGTGVYYYIVPNFSKVLDPQVWVQAAGQIFFSTSVCMGGMVSLSSYNNFDNNIVIDTLLIVLGNCLTSVLAGFSMFTSLGFLADQQSLQVGEVTRSSSGLAFVSMPTAITLMPTPPVFAVIFFSMLIMLGLDSQLAFIETIITGAQDVYPLLRSSKKHKAACVGVFCFVMFLVGFICCTNAGEAWIDILDTYMVSYPLIVVGFVEAAGITFLYGERRLSDYATRCGIFRSFTFLKEGIFRILADTDTMIRENKHYKRMRTCWMHYIAVSFYIIAPELLLILVVSTYYSWVRPEHEPDSIIALSWILYVLVVLPIPIFFFYEVCTRKKGHQFAPLSSWGPTIEPRAAFEVLQSEENNTVHDDLLDNDVINEKNTELTQSSEIRDERKSFSQSEQEIIVDRRSY